MLLASFSSLTFIAQRIYCKTAACFCTLLPLSLTLHGGDHDILTGNFGLAFYDIFDLCPLCIGDLTLSDDHIDAAVCDAHDCIGKSFDSSRSSAAASFSAFSVRAVISLTAFCFCSSVTFSLLMISSRVSLFWIVPALWSVLPGPQSCCLFLCW